ncbi:hypothetical protein AMTRI_Chr02g217970 [Amborella trichopoda]
MEAQLQPPDDFKCPISLEIMSDPVILPSGHTFDRASIQRWLDSGHRTCPITQLPLPPHPTLIPNLSLRSLICLWSKSHNHPLPQPLPYSSTTTPSIHSLILSLSSPSSTLPHKLHSLHHLNHLSRHSRHLLTDSGAIPALLACANDPRLQYPSLLVLFNLSDTDHNKVGLVAEGVVPTLVSALSTGSPAARALAATTTTSLALVDVNKATIGSYPGVIPALIRLLSDVDHPRGRREAATALYTLCAFPDNERRAAEAGAAQPLLGMGLHSAERPAEVLSLMAKCKEGREAIEKCEGCVGVLVRVLREGSSRSKQHALATLASLCEHNACLAWDARREGALCCGAQMVKDENVKIRRNAMRLVRALEKGSDSNSTR